MATGHEISADELLRARLDEFESQAIFRILMNAFARPGTILSLPQQLAHRCPAVLLPLVALLGHDTPFTVLGAGSEHARMLVARVTGGRPTDDGQTALLAVLDPVEIADVLRIGRGSDLRPDHGSQVSVACKGRLRSAFGSNESVDGEVRLSLHGPGIATTRDICFDRPNSHVMSILDARLSTGATGYDIWIFDDHGQVVGLPRTTHIEFTNFADLSTGDL